VKSNIEVLVSIGLGERAKEDALLVRDTCTILLTLNKTEEKVRIKYVENFFQWLQYQMCRSTVGSILN
jgi:hypothetical protein